MAAGPSVDAYGVSSESEVNKCHFVCPSIVVGASVNASASKAGSKHVSFFPELGTAEWIMFDPTVERYRGFDPNADINGGRQDLPNIEDWAHMSGQWPTSQTLTGSSNSWKCENHFG